MGEQFDPYASCSEHRYRAVAAIRASAGVVETAAGHHVASASANRDGSVHECPEELRLDRPRWRDHLAFGAGPHVRPGASLARMKTVASVEEVCCAVPAMRLADGFVPQPNPVFWAFGHRSLPVVLEPA